MIDVVIPWVNNNDRVWQQRYIQYFLAVDYKRVAELRGNRFEDIGIIQYQLKLVEKNMPFVRKIFLLVSNKEQVDFQVSSKVQIVLHNEFIPSKYLPTFNSTTIEMFLHNIKDLSEHFIYANDDMLPLNELKETDFFEGDKIKMNYRMEECHENDNSFRNQCLNSYQHICDLLGMGHNETSFIKPDHSMSPMIKSHLKLVIESLGDIVLKPIRAWRTPEQHNQYLYLDYEILTNNCLRNQISFLYTEFKNETDIEEMGKYQIVCLNQIPNRVGKQVLQKLEELCK